MNGNDNISADADDLVPADMVGTWQVAGTAQQFKITANGGYHAVDSGSPYTLVDPNTLEWPTGRTTYTRVYGSPGELVGVWFEDEYQEEITLRADGSFSTYWHSGEQYAGTYSANDTHISTTELYSLITVDADYIVFQPAYAPPSGGAYVIESPDRWHYFPDSGGQVTYDRI